MNHLRTLILQTVLILFVPMAAWAEVYGYVEGFNEPQPLTTSQIQAIRTITHDSIPTWLAIVTELDTDNPKLHIIDTEHFAQFPTDYGIHQAYAQEMGIVSGKADFIARLKENGQRRSIMPYTFYIPAAALQDQGVQAQWVLQNRRYIFLDSTASFTEDLDRSADLFQREMSPFFSGKPFFITYEKENSTRRPNLLTSQGRADIAALQSLGYGVITEREMATLAGQTSALVRVHNSAHNNEAVGYVQVVENQNDIDLLTPQHIAIFPSLPDRVPPVAAIVTLEDQTELSHINVLAINRGTLNVAVSQTATGLVSEILQFAQSAGDRPVRLAVGNETVSMELAQDSQVAAFQELMKQDIQDVEIPEIQLNGNLGVRKPGPTDSPSTIGAKADNYGKIERLLGHQFVKQGFAIGFDLYRAIVTQGGVKSIEEVMIRPMLNDLKAGLITPRAVNARLAEIREAIASASLPPVAIVSMAALANGPYENLSDEEKIRFRSSTNCEDLPLFNGAGLYLSEGIKIKHLRRAVSADAEVRRKAIEKIHEDLLLVMGSLWLPRAFWEREYFSIDHMKAGMAIQINPSFSGEVANGVIIASQNSNSVDYWVNTQSGEASVTNPESGEIPESIKFSSEASSVNQFLQNLPALATTVHSQSTIQSVFLNQKGEISPKHSQQLAELVSGTRQIFESMVEDIENFGIDIEFKLMREAGQIKIYIKQARPLNLASGH